jgi:hypothetical protein
MGEITSRKVKRVLEKTWKEKLRTKSTGLAKEHLRMGCQHRSDQRIVDSGKAAHADSANQMVSVVEERWHK